MLTILGHLGVWAGLYALAAFVCFAQLAGMTPGSLLPRWDAMVCVFLTATGVYSIDRVKLFSGWLDPADVEAQPERYSFLTRKSGLVRVFALALLVGAGSVGYGVHPWMPVLVGIAALSTVAYAPRPRRTAARIKDLVWLKNGYVAAGMTFFAMLMTVLSLRPDSIEEMRAVVMDSKAALSVAFGVVFLRIFFDAALCDIDDEPTDRRFRTETFATRVGSIQVWNWAGIGRLVTAFFLFAALPLPFLPRVSWAIAMLLGMIALRWRHPVRIRDTVDIRFLPEAAGVTLILWIVSTFRS